MKGYVKNKSAAWTHALKRAIGPGAKIPLEELYLQYGEKHGIPEGEAFVSWLREVKLRDKTRWDIVLNPVEVPVEPEAEVKKEKEFVSKTSIKKITIEEIVGLSVRKARAIIPEITDIKLLKYALQEANPRAGKDSLCKLLRKRIAELESGSF